MTKDWKMVYRDEGLVTYRNNIGDKIIIAREYNHKKKGDDFRVFIDVGGISENKLFSTRLEAKRYTRKFKMDKRVPIFKDEQTKVNLLRTIPK